MVEIGRFFVPIVEPFLQLAGLADPVDGDARAGGLQRQWQSADPA